MHNEKYSRLFTTDDMSVAVRTIAQRIIGDFPADKPLFVALMRGANPFASMLMFEIARQQVDFHPEIDYMLVSTYGKDHTAKEPVVMTDLAPDTVVADRTVVLIDDVIDLGVTSDFVARLMRERGAADVKLAVLASKDVPARTSQADYIGFEAGDKWLVGMGLDDAQDGHEHYRWLDEVWEINR